MTHHSAPAVEHPSALHQSHHSNQFPQSGSNTSQPRRPYSRARSGTMLLPPEPTSSLRVQSLWKIDLSRRLKSIYGPSAVSTMLRRSSSNGTSPSTRTTFLPAATFLPTTNGSAHGASDANGTPDGTTYGCASLCPATASCCLSRLPTASVPTSTAPVA